MPSFDSGYYQLTSLIPIRQDGEDPLLWRWQAQPRSAIHSLRQLLDSLPGVDLCRRNSDGAEGDEPLRAVPFSRSDRTHFARLVVIEDLAYNGRKQGDTLIAMARKGLANAGWRWAAIPEREAPDHLPHPYLLVALDFDATNGRADSVEQYLHELWETMEQEWTLILRHCRGFELEPRRRRASFVSVILAHEIETTFGYCAYGWSAARAERWQPGAPLREAHGSQRAPGLLKPALGVGLLLAGVAAAAIHQIPLWWILLVVIASLPLLWQSLMTRANRPWPAQPGTDLRSVLKALYLQAAFLEMAEGWQNRDPVSNTSLRRHFRDFLHAAQPDDPDAPSLAPGRIHAIRHSHQP